jgi:uncharacterized SAM-binding protein YcdF (DUF218 family)
VPHPSLAEGHRHDEDSLSRPSVPESSDRLSGLVRRVPLARTIEGGAIGVALWCILFIFQLLPAIAADTPGVLLFGIAGVAIGVSRLRRSLLVILAVGAAMVVVVTQTSVSNVVASRWIREDQFPDSAVAAVVVLSAGVNANATISGEALDHLITGLELIRAGKATVLVTTTVEQKFPAGVVTSTVDQSRIVALFGGQVQWLRTPPGNSTREEALGSATLLMPRGIRRIAIVASPMHTRRACSTFEGVGFEVTCVPARVRSPGGRGPASWPADRLSVFGDWMYEVAATAKYRANGWLDSPQLARPGRAP